MKNNEVELIMRSMLYVVPMRRRNSGKAPWFLTSVRGGLLPEHFFHSLCPNNMEILEIFHKS